MLGVFFANGVSSGGVVIAGEMLKRESMVDALLIYSKSMTSTNCLGFLLVKVQCACIVWHEAPAVSERVLLVLVGLWAELVALVDF